MVMPRTGLLVAMVALCAAPLAARAQGCAAAPTPQMTPFDTTRASEIAGNYELVMVDTTSLRGNRQHAGRLALWMQDSLPRRTGVAARRTQKQFLVGSFEVAAPDSGEMWRRMASRTPEAPGVFWSDGFLRLGEFGAKSGISVYVRNVTADELRGMWTSHPGIGVVVDFTGDREPDEAGFFCAKRIK
jgi:hypothetical protein